MPFTPLHMGPGSAAKALFGPYFSLLVFGLTQVVIDIEPLIRLINGDHRLHGHSHTYLGAIILSLMCFAIGLPLFRWFVSKWNSLAADPMIHISERLTTTSALLGAIIGGVSHIVLDSIMHSDMRAYWPWSDAQPLLNLISTGTLHYFCLISGVLGLLIIFFRHYWFYVRQHQNNNQKPLQ